MIEPVQACYPDDNCRCIARDRFQRIRGSQTAHVRGSDPVLTRLPLVWGKYSIALASQ